MRLWCALPAINSISLISTDIESAPSTDSDLPGHSSRITGYSADEDYSLGDPVDAESDEQCTFHGLSLLHSKRL